jgi:hypothetical protein
MDVKTKSNILSYSIIILVLVISWAVFPSIANWQAEGLGLKSDPMTHMDALKYIAWTVGIGGFIMWGKKRKEKYHGKSS